MKFTIKKSLIGATLAMATLVPAHSANGVLRIYMTVTGQGQSALLPVYSMRTDVQEAVAAAMSSAATTIGDVQARVEFARGATLREIIGKSGAVMTVFSLAMVGKLNSNITVGAVATEAAISVAPAALISFAQEYYAVKLQNKYGFRGEPAKFLTFGVAQIAISSWSFWLRPYIGRELAKYFYPDSPDELRRRQLLQISSSENFAYNLQNEHVIDNIKWKIGNYGFDFDVNGWSRSKWGTRFYYTLNVSDPVGSQVTYKTIFTCKSFLSNPGKATCTTQNIL